MKDMDKVKLLGLFLVVVIAMGLPTVVKTFTEEPLNDEDLHLDKLEVYTLPHYIPLGTLALDTSNITTYVPLYYRNTSIEGFLVNGTDFMFKEEFPFDVWYSLRWNNTW